MTDVWYPGATVRRGFNAGYTNGKTAMQTVKMHFTVGVDSTGRGDQGYFQFLVPKDGPPIQFAEVDALCWDSGTWNGDGPGIEFERLSYDEPLTDSQIRQGHDLIHWLNQEWHFPLTLWDGERVLATDCGFINHGSVLGRGTEHADHTDGVLRSEWDQMLGSPAPPPPPAPSPGDNRMQMLDYAGTTVTFHVDAKGRFIQNTYELGRGHTLVDKVILTGNDPRIQPSIALHGDVISVSTVDTAGRGRFFSFLPGSGWVDANGKSLP